MAAHERSRFRRPPPSHRISRGPACGACVHGDARRRARRRAVRLHAAFAADAARRRVRSAANRHRARRLARVVQLRGLLCRRAHVRGVARGTCTGGARGARTDRAVDARDGRHEPVLGVGGGALRRGRGQRVDFRFRVAVGLAAARRAPSTCVERRDLYGAGRRHRRNGAAGERGGRLWRDGGLDRLRPDFGGAGGGRVAGVWQCGRV